MSLLVEKFKEVAKTLTPVVILVMVLCFTIVDVETDILVRFLVCSILLLIGLAIFLWGVDLSMDPIGEYMSTEVATSRSPIKVAVLSFLLGFLITVAEPDLLILGNQIEDASGGTLPASLIVGVVSVGVGVMISLAVFRLLKSNPPYNVFMAVTYTVIFLLALFVSEEFLAISFDASGATTGALTTPFVLALSLGLSKVKGGKTQEEDAFGLVGAMSAGPILAIMLLSIISGQKNIQGTAEAFVPTEGIIKPILNTFPTILLESLVALLPIAALFFIYNLAKFKIPKKELGSITKALLITLVGLAIFLTAVNSGFMEMGRMIGMQIGDMSPWVLILIGFILGFIIVLVEPAVHVLGEQIEEVTSGHIPVKIIKTTLSIGVGTAIALSMVRIVVPEVKLWYFLLPGFLIAIILSFVVDPIFVGIAYDAGGVASGPMTATFILAFAQGAADVVPTANVLVDGFGVIAMVAMAPVFSIMVLGTLFKHKRVALPEVGVKAKMPSTFMKEQHVQHDAIMVVVNRGFADKVVDVARDVGATGATIMHGRGSGPHEQKLPLLNVELQPEKEIVMLITITDVTTNVANGLMANPQLVDDGEIVVFVSGYAAMVKTIPHEADEVVDGVVELEVLKD